MKKYIKTIKKLNKMCDQLIELMIKIAVLAYLINHIF